ncbi:uncharacterized protein BDZ99DRAFT_420347 [Mytilinidion resinicola]|uniref:Uncharacterized protein n=1 Tax=Mytilinidion resinicola TaxID=574789 RepID=A0A6A6YGS7_9PEZI|nr:uncharacterized protein BDZ99DRAFT_420347 [Mytilinidion resinicola]KAF2807799.1 hypothetical protein BDZ99DRAFT_420347 [Mytilinidion resinicola]
MFGFSSSSFLAGRHDATKERTPPSKPTPVVFPSFLPEPSVSREPPKWTTGDSSDLTARFVAIRKPSDVTAEHLALLNVTCEHPGDFESLLSTSPNGLSFLPPTSWLEPLQEGVEVDPPNRVLSNGRKPLDRKDFYIRAKELYCTNEDAFSVLTRTPKLNQPAPRLAHFRRFWEGLDNMAYYWDTSLDEYIPPAPEAAHEDPEDSDSPSKEAPANDRGLQAEIEAMNVEEPRKKAKTVIESPKESPLPTPETKPEPKPYSKPTPPATIYSSSSLSLPARTQPPKVPGAAAPEPAEKIPGTYRGSRLGNGAEMPDAYRLDTVRGFLEPIAWAFGLTLVPHRRPPALALESVRFPVRMSTVAWRAPADRTRARAGWLEGPVLGVQCRAETEFGSGGSLEAESVLDVVRELGGLLLLSQERTREGKTERKPGDGKWWVTRPRWGGGLGGEVGEASGGSDVPVEKEKEKEEKPVRTRLGGRERRRMSAAEIWKVLKPGNGFWDPKVEYQAVGKSSDAEWDEVYMVSSLNHHVSILKLRVHPLYVQFLTDGVLPRNLPKDEQWASPVLHRTRWYDFFVVEDRIELMRGLWGIMGYLMRQEENVDTTMKDS